MTGISQQLRFSSDEENYSKLLSDETISALAKKRLKDVQEDGYRRDLLGNSLRISSKIAPDLFSLMENAQAKLGLNGKSIEVYIYNSADLNASCAYLGGDRIILTFSSGLLKTMSHDELNFVVGHELGHALFEHYALPTHGILDENNLGAEKAMQLMFRSRRAEVSADRAGLYVCESPAAAINSFLKLSCGVADPIISFNRDEYATQIRELGELGNNLEDTTHCYSSHPFNPIRVLAVELYAKSHEYSQITGNGSNGMSLASVDKEINRVLKFMEPVPSEQHKAIIAECLCWGGIWVALADGDFVEAEHENLKEQVEEDVYNRCIEELSKSCSSSVHARDKFFQSVAPLKSLSAPDRCAFIQRLIVVARSDNNLADSEKNVLCKICDELRVEQSFIQQILVFLD